MPRSLPTIVGTRVLRDQLARSKFSSVTFIPPSVDVDHDSPEFDQGTFRKEAGIDEQTMLVAIVSRLSAMKMESMRQTMDAVADLSANNDIRLVIVGGGRLEEVIREKANGLNERMGREVISLTGSLGDPRPVYAAADVVVGMGSSALRGLAFAKPVIVVGDNGYVELFTPETSGEFLVQGFWGLGEGDGVERLTYQLQSLNDDAERREILGAFGRKFACDRFSLVKQADALAEVYKQALEKPPQPADRRSEVTRTVARLMADRGLGFVRRRFTS